MISVFRLMTIRIPLELPTTLRLKILTEAANAAYAAMMKAGIIARQMGGYGLPECIRITIGLEDENQLVVQALEGHLNG